MVRKLIKWDQKLLVTYSLKSSSMKYNLKKTKTILNKRIEHPTSYYHVFN